jgi:hypothetical protein
MAARSFESTLARLPEMRDDASPFPAILLVVLSLTLVVTCYLMSQVPQPTSTGGESYATFGSESCASYLGTSYDC